MQEEPSRELLRDDPNTVVLSRHRNSCFVEAQGPTRLLNRAQVPRRQWSPVRRCWRIAIQDMPAVIRRAERDGRVVLIESDDE
ncbi:MAG: hypothetical protein JWM31_1156 [Solirubrobacterales bacterium]|nr:hypothetical protein [Solirubrobacterales bacterium]